MWTTTLSSKWTTCILPSFVRRRVLGLVGPDKQELADAVLPVFRVGVDKLIFGVALFSDFDVVELLFVSVS